MFTHVTTTKDNNSHNVLSRLKSGNKENYNKILYLSLFCENIDEVCCKFWYKTLPCMVELRCQGWKVETGHSTLYTALRYTIAGWPMSRLKSGNKKITCVSQSVLWCLGLQKVVELVEQWMGLVKEGTLIVLHHTPCFSFISLCFRRSK